MSDTSSEQHSDIEDNAPVTYVKPQRITNLYIKDFGTDMDESELCELFATYGSITSCKIQTDERGLSKGFGFVNFENPTMAKNAVDNLGGYVLENGKKLYVDFFQKKEKRHQEQRQTYIQSCKDRNLYVSNLDQTFDDESLKQAFAKYGHITSAKVMLQGGQCKGHGFVCFSTAEEATEAIAAMNGQQLGLKMIYVALSKGQTARPKPSNDRYPPRTAVPWYSSTFQRPPHQFQTPRNRQVPSMTRISTCLPSRIYSPFNGHQSQLHSRENSKITVQSNINSTSSDEDEANESRNLPATYQKTDSE